MPTVFTVYLNFKILTFCLDFKILTSHLDSLFSEKTWNCQNRWEDLWESSTLSLLPYPTHWTTLSWTAPGPGWTAPRPSVPQGCRSTGPPRTASRPPWPMFTSSTSLSRSIPMAWPCWFSPWSWWRCGCGGAFRLSFHMLGDIRWRGVDCLGNKEIYIRYRDLILVALLFL